MENWAWYFKELEIPPNTSDYVAIARKRLEHLIAEEERIEQMLREGKELEKLLYERAQTETS